MSSVEALPSGSVPTQGLQRVLLLRTGHLGDTICAIPAFRLLRQHFHDAHLTLLCDRPARGKVAARDVIERLNLFDDILTYESSRGLTTLWELYRLVRHAKPQLVVQLPQLDRLPQDYARQRFFFHAAGVRRLIGFWRLDEQRTWHPTEAARLVGLLNREGIPGPKPACDLPIDAAAEQSMRAKLASSGIDLARPYIVFCGGGKTTSQHWPLDWYSEVMAHLHRELGVQFIGIGTPAEVAAFRNQVLPDYPQLVLPEERLSLSELCELERNALAYLGNDTGPMHVAAAVQCPTVAVISARNLPGQFDPDVGTRLVFRHRTPCEGCRLSDCNVEGHPCLRTISPGMVIEQTLPFLRELLERATPTARV